MRRTADLWTFFTLFTACAVASALFGLLYHFDNKYTTAAPLSQDGAAVLAAQDGTGSGKITWLVQGWEFYPDQLLGPGETGRDAQSVSIGQYFSFAAFHGDGSPHGAGTYRLTVRGDGIYTMLLPEVFSACTVYAGGEQIAASGSVAPYVPQIRDLVFSFEVHGETELLIQTANYTHYYSGVTYPPAVGTGEAVSRLIAVRMLFYGFLAFTSLALALFAAVIWFGTRKTGASGENFWLGILGLSFSLRVCYPFIHMLGSSGQSAAYVLENTMAALGLFCIVRTVSLLCLETGSLAERVLTGIAGGFVAVAGVFPLWMTTGLPGFVPVYGQILYWYKAAAAVAMTVLVLCRSVKRSSGQERLLLAGLLAYAVSLVFHALCLGRYEPAYTGWYEEWGTYFLILCFAARMALKNMEILRENRRLNEHLQEEIARKTESLSRLLEERRLLLSAFAHDLKTPVTSIHTFTRLVEMDSAGLDEESRQYLDVIRRKTAEIQEQLSTLREFTRFDSAPPSFEPLDLCGLLREFCAANEPDVDACGLSLELQTGDGRPVMVYGDRQKLTSVLQNLVFNAVSFTPEGGCIRLSLGRKEGFAVLRVEDNGAGIAQEDLPYIFDRLFTHRPQEDGSGMGLFLVKSVVTEHKGTIEADSEPGKGSVFTIRLPLLT